MDFECSCLVNPLLAAAAAAVLSTPLPPGHKLLVVCLLAAGLLLLDLGISGRELAVRLARSQHLLHQRLLPLLACQTTTVEVCGSLYESAHLGVLRKRVLARVLLPVLLGVYDTAQPQQLELALDLGILNLCARHVVPAGTGVVRSILLIFSSATQK